MEVILSGRTIPLNHDWEKNKALIFFFTRAKLDAKATKTSVSPTLGNEINHADFLLKLTGWPMAGTSNNVDRRSEPGFCLALRMRGRERDTWRFDDGTCPCGMCRVIAGYPDTYFVLSRTIFRFSNFPWRGRSARALWKRWCRVRVDPPVTGQAVSYRFRSSEMACWAIWTSWTVLFSCDCKRHWKDWAGAIFSLQTYTIHDM